MFVFGVNMFMFLYLQTVSWSFISFIGAMDDPVSFCGKRAQLETWLQLGWFEGSICGLFVRNKSDAAQSHIGAQLVIQYVQ